MNRDYKETNSNALYTWIAFALGLKHEIKTKKYRKAIYQYFSWKVDLTDKKLMKLEQIKEKYGNVKLKLNSYYKYTFSFTGITEDNEEVHAFVGGSADDVYKLNVSAEKEETINSLCPNYISVSKEGKKIVDWND